jgi:hypothetical protein
MALRNSRRHVTIRLPWLIRINAPTGERPAHSIALANDLFDQLDDAAAEPGVFEEHERLGKGQAVGGGEKVRDVIRRAGFPRAAPSVWLDRVVEEEGDRDLKGAGYQLQSAGADAVRSLLVFLDLLKGQTQRSAQVGLAH